MLDGDFGEAKALAMKLLVSVGKAFDAERLIPICSAQISGVSFKTIGAPGLEFLEDLASKRAETSTSATLNPAGMDLTSWRRMGVPRDFAINQLRIIRAFRRMGIRPTCTCIPYLSGSKPRLGEHVAWAESSAVAFVNSVLGARTNREGGPTALASALTGRTPLYGLHLDEEREVTHVIDIRAKILNELDYSLLGYVIGKRLGYSVPFLRNLKIRCVEHLKALGASAAASGSIALYHVEHLTPESHKFKRLKGFERLTVDSQDIRRAEGELSVDEDFNDVLLGCPHCGLEELKKIATALSSRTLKERLWCFTSTHVYDRAKKLGYVQRIEKLGGRVLRDTCMVVAPVETFGVDGVITNSCKAAHYLPSTSGLKVKLSSLESTLRIAAR